MEECIPFHVRDVPALSPHASLNGLTAKTIPAARQKIQPEPNEVIVSVVWRGKQKQISINPSYLVPWPPSEGNKVVIIRQLFIGEVGKLVNFEHGTCAVELELSGKVVYFHGEDVVNVLKK